MTSELGRVSRRSVRWLPVALFGAACLRAAADLPYDVHAGAPAPAIASARAHVGAAEPNLDAARLPALARERPRIQAPLQDEPVWHVSGMPGGAIYDLSVAALDDVTDEDVQLVFAAGNEVFASNRGDAWNPPLGVPGARNITAGAGGGVMASTGQGEAWYSNNYGRRWSRTWLRERSDPVRFLAISPAFADDGQAYGVTSEDHRLYRTDNGGRTWSEVVLEAGAPSQVGAVAFSPLHLLDQVLFAGTDRGIYFSSRSGDTWERLAAAGPDVPAFGAGAGPLRSQGMQLAREWGDHPCKPRDPDVREMFAWNSGGLWHSADEGATWGEIDLPAEVEVLEDAVISHGWPDDKTILVAAAGPGILGAMSPDGGASWRLIPGRDGIAGIAVAIARDFWQIPPPVACPPDTRVSLGFDVFLNFAAMNHPFPTGDDYWVPEVIPQREMTLATDGDGILRSLDEGATWEAPDVRVQAVEPTALVWPSSGDSILAGTSEAGLYRSADAGATWALVEATGLPRGEGQRINRIVASPDFDRDRTLFMAAAAGLFVSRDGGATWSRTPGPAPARALAISPAFAADGTVMSDGFISRDRGATWTALPGADGWPWHAAMFSPRYESDRTLWSGTIAVGSETEPGREERQFGLFRSTDDGATWSPIELSGLRRRGVSSLAAASVTTAEDIRIFMGSPGGLYTSTDGGDTFTRTSELSGREVRDLSVRVINEPFVTAILAAVTNRGFYYSRNRGVTWQSDADAPEDLVAVALDPAGARVAVALPLAAGVRRMPASAASR